VIFDLFFRVKTNPLDKIYFKKLLDLLKVNNIDEDEVLKTSKFPIAYNIKNLFTDINIDNFHLKLNILDNIINEYLEEDDLKKFALDELNEYKDLLILYKKENNKPTLE